jgi:hypothetical protein
LPPCIVLIDWLDCISSSNPLISEIMRFDGMVGRDEGIVWNCGDWFDMDILYCYIILSGC